MVLVGLALIAYVYIEYVITYWFSPYLQTDLNFDVKTVGYIIGILWLFVALGGFFFGEFEFVPSNLIYDREEGRTFSKLFTNPPCMYPGIKKVSHMHRRGTHSRTSIINY